MSRPRTPVTFGAAVVDGRVVFDVRHLFDAAMSRWRGRVTVTVAPERQERSLRANAYYWGVVLKLMADASGYRPDDLHEILKVRHNSKRVLDPETGDEIRIGQSTATMKVDEFSVYLERCMVDGATWFGVSFPPPRPAEDWRV